MNRYGFISCICAFCMISAVTYAQSSSEGYYKDVFMDGGMSLTSRWDLPATRALGLSLELVRSSKTADRFYGDTLAQNAAFVGTEFDSNGVLLYPDGAPRFRLLYLNGGSGATHGRTITAPGRQHIRDFVKAGGSYLGSCAGAYLATQGVHSKDSTGKYKEHIYEEYIGVYPGLCTNAQLQNTYVELDVPENSPVLKYYSFKNNHIDRIYHNGGCYMDYDALIPGAEILFEYNYPPKSMHGNGAVWSYKENEYTGRTIACGPHPEGHTTGVLLDMTCAMVRYCLDGNGKPRIKGCLNNGEPRQMSCTTEDSDPEHTRIGDKQYHHFVVDVPEGLDSLSISLKAVQGYTDFDLFLFASYDGPAFRSNAKHINIKLGVDKVLKIVDPMPGKLYVSVYCDTTVDVEKTEYGTQYSGRLDVLNGVPYVLQADY